MYDVLSIGAATLCSFALGQLLVLTFPQHRRYTSDLPGAAQKFHVSPTPRVGGVGVYVSAAASAFLLRNTETGKLLHVVLLAGLPALLIGLLEDITKQVSVRLRLAATFASGLLACAFSGLALSSVAVPVLDSLLRIGPIAIAFTAFATAGVANALNIIDGFNGLASGTAAIALAAIAFVAWHAGDLPLALCCLVLIGAIAGFWLLNFPWGKLFLGDGGAYFAGFALAWMAVLLPLRNPSVSPWASLLACGYPVIEVLYSVARRWRSRQPAGQADRGHLHSLVATRFVQRRLRDIHPALQNSAVSVLMWICAAIPALLGVTFRASTLWLALGALACALLYHWLYRQVARS
jgi:UDP-N-acetylmuramyl pentapeptide phosphotransferase/UDP-N-acetylglucosamine-1-phosphate transferase